MSLSVLFPSWRRVSDLHRDRQPSSVHVHEPEVSLMDKRRRLQGLTGRLLRQPLGCRHAQLLVDEGQQLLGGGRVAVFDGVQDAGDFAHGGGSRSG